MATYILLENDNPILRVPLSGLSEDLDRGTLTENLVETMREYKGIGLSASQCGVMERVFVMYSDVKGRKIISCYNPQILEYSEEIVEMDEGCLTFPGLWLKIKRPEGIKVQFEDETGTKQEYQLFGLESRIFQHEMDHMEGTDFTQRVSKLRLDMGRRRQKKMQKKSMISMG